jgi:hypothetical protein
MYLLNKTNFMQNNERKEGPVAKTIETQTSKIPSDVFLWSAFGSMAISLALKIAGRDKQAQFVGQWAAPILIMGLYNKVVKLEGHDKDDKDEKEGKEEKNGNDNKVKDNKHKEFSM